MRSYAYTAYDEAGKKKTGTVVAETEADATVRLKGGGLFVSDLAMQTPANAGLGKFARPARLSNDLQAVFTRQMAVLLTAGLPAEQALEAVHSAGDAGLSAVAARAQSALLDGAGLSEALNQSGAGFPPYFIASLEAGETAGSVAEVFEELAVHLETIGTDKTQIATALIYPAFVAVVSLLVCAILMTTVAPEIVSMFEISGRPLPPLTQTVMAISGWIETHIILVGCSILALVVLGIASGRVPVLRAIRDRIVLRLPIVGGLMRRAAAVQYLRTLALVLASRNTVPAATASASGVLDVAQFRTEAQNVSTALGRGDTLSDALRALSIIPPVARQLIQAGEASARLARMTERAAVMVENGLSTERKRIAALLEPMLMMLVGALVLTIVLAVLLPIFDLQAMVAG